MRGDGVRGARGAHSEKEKVDSMVTQPTPAVAAEFAAAPPVDLAEEAYVRVRPELDAVDDKSLGRITANALTAVLILVGALPNLEALREAIEALPGQAPGAIDKLHDYAHAMMHVHAMGSPGPAAETRLQALLVEAAPLRERLLSTAELSVKFGFFDGDQVAAIRKGSGQVDAANDLLSLARIFRARWAELEGKVPVTTDEVERAGTLGVELLNALGRRKVGSEGARPPREYEQARARLFHLLVRTYDQVQRAVVYLRWDEGDADVVLPSIFQGRPRRRRAAEAPSPETPAGPTPAEPTPAEPVTPGELDEA